MSRPRPWQKTTDALIYEKECLPVRQITRWVGDDKEELKVKVKEEFLQNIVEQFNKFESKGIRVPLYKTHKEDPDNDRGTVIGVAVKKNDRGVPSLYARVKFHNEEFRDKGLRNDVSVLCPPRFKDADGEEYNYPLRHLALTSTPVVPGLEGFTPLVLSFDTPSGLMLADEEIQTEDSVVNEEKWAALLALLGISAPEDSTTDDQLDLVIAAVEELQGEEETTEEGAKEEAVAFSYPPMLVSQMRKGRETMIDGLVEKQTISPAVGKELKEKFCTKDSIKADLELSGDSDGETEFDRAISLAKKIAGDRPLQSTGRKTIKLSHDDGDEDNPLIRAAKAAREKAKAKAGK